MIVIGTDAHKSTHTAVAVDAGTGQLRDELTAPARTRGFDQFLAWGRALDSERVWAIEDVRHVSGSFERYLIAHGERVIRVPPKLMGASRRAERERGKSDAIDALAVARAALREGPENLPAAQLDHDALEIKLLLDHREDLVRERTAQIQRLRWHLHDVDAGLEPQLRGLRAQSTRRSLAHRLARREQTVQVSICRELLGRISEIGRRERELQAEISRLVRTYCPQLLELPGCGELTAAKLVAEIAGAERFSSDAQLARHSGCAPLPASSGNSRRHRLSRRGNRELNCAFHRIAVTQARIHPEARSYLDRKRSQGHSTREALRCLKRHLVRRAWQLLRARPGRIDSPSPMINSPKLRPAPDPRLT
jgi:transposase